MLLKAASIAARKLSDECCPKMDYVPRFVADNGISIHWMPFAAVAANVLGREFSASAPDSKWAGDITYIPTAEGWLYLAVVLDMFSRKVVGWAMSHKTDANLACAALKMAIETRNPDSGLLHHSDQGCQYTSSAFTDLLEQNEIACSMSRTGNCWDNAVVESIFSKLKREWMSWKRYKTREEARQDVFIYLEIFYNRQRRHATLDYQSPEAFEKKNNLNKQMAA